MILSTSAVQKQAAPHHLQYGNTTVCFAAICLAVTILPFAPWSSNTSWGLFAEDSASSSCHGQQDKKILRHTPLPSLYQPVIVQVITDENWLLLPSLSSDWMIICSSLEAFPVRQHPPLTHSKALYRTGWMGQRRSSESSSVVMGPASDIWLAGSCKLFRICCTLHFPLPLTMC